MQETPQQIMEKALLKVKRNKILAIGDMGNLPHFSHELLAVDVRYFNLLDWAIAYHNYGNIAFLVEYLDPNKCTMNCFERLLRGVIGTPNQKNITAITNLLLKKNCTIPDNLFSQKNSPRMRECYKEAEQILRDAQSKNLIIVQQIRKSP